MPRKGTYVKGLFLAVVFAQALAVASPAAADVTIPSPGMSGTSIITITPMAGYTGSLALNCAVVRSLFATSNLDPPTCSVAALSANSGPVTAMLTVNTNATTSIGSYTLTVADTAGNITPISLALTIQEPTAVVLTAAPAAPVAPGANTSSTITITPTGDFNLDPVMGGFVTYCSSDSPPIVNNENESGGNTAQCTITQPSPLSGPGPVTATLTLITPTDIPVGSYTATAQAVAYIPIPNTVPSPLNYQSVSANVPVTVVAPGAIPSISLAVGPSAAHITAGGSATSIITTTPSGGFTGNVTFGCSLSPYPSPAAAPQPTCEASAATISGTEAVTTTLIISTTAPVAAARDGTMPQILRLASGGVGTLVFLGWPIRRRRWRTLRNLLLVVIAAAGVNGCSGRDTAATPNDQINPPIGSLASPGTSAGVYNILVTGSSGAVSAGTIIAVHVAD